MAESAAARRIAQTAYWEERYLRDPSFFGPQPSRFARWALRILHRSSSARHLVEIGCGYGRDVRFFADHGLEVRAVDPSETGVALARAALTRRPAPLGKASVSRSSALAFLTRIPPEWADAVFSNLVWNMDFTEEEHLRHFRAVRRVLRPGGLHLYSVRSTSDPWFGKGRRLRTATYDLAPHGTVMRFFSRAYARRLARRSGLRTVELSERLEGGRRFPIRVLYVAELRPTTGPSPPSAAHRSGRPRAARASLART